MSIQILNNGASLKIVRDGVSSLILKQQVKEISTSGASLKIETCGCSTSCLFLPYAEVSNPSTPDVTALRDAINVMLNAAVEGASLSIEGFSTEQKQVEELSRLLEIKNTLSSTSDAITGSLSNKATQAGQTQIKAAIESGNDLLTLLYNDLPVLFSNLKAGASTLAEQELQLAELQWHGGLLSDLKGALLNNALFNQAYRIDNSTPNITYRGYADPGTQDPQALWAIQKETRDEAGIIAIRWADGNKLFNKIWDNRAAYSYL